MLIFFSLLQFEELKRNLHNSFPFTSRRLVFASLDRLLEKIQNSMDRRVRIQARWMEERERESEALQSE